MLGTEPDEPAVVPQQAQDGPITGRRQAGFGYGPEMSVERPDRIEVADDVVATAEGRPQASCFPARTLEG